MAITPAPGYMIDPSNPNGVIPIGSAPSGFQQTQTQPITYGSTNTTQTPVSAPVSVLSSSTGQNIVNQNTSSLQKIESGYMGPSIVDYLNSTGQSSDYASRSKLAADKGIQNYTGSADQNTQLLQALRNVSSSPGSSAMVNDLNKAVSGGVGMTSSEQQGLSDLQKTQDELTASAAKARAALESKDYKSMDYWTAKAEADRTKYEQQLSDYYASTKELRSALTNSMIPGANEQALTQKLNDIRSQADQFALQTEQDKFAEYNGQTLGFAGGRAAQIDRKASFKNQEYALKEKNLLLSLGLEQSARKLSGDVATQQLGFLSEDFNLQQKIQDKLDAQEEDLFNKANTLEDNAKSTLVSILDSLQGIDPANMGTDSLKQLQDMASRANIPFNLVQDALKTQYNKFVFDQAKANKPTSDEKSSAEVSRVGNILNKAKGEDGYTDPNLYSRERASSSLSPTDFDNRFGYLVNPASRANLGITSGVAGNQPGSLSGTDLTKATNWVLNNKGTQDDLNKLQSDRDFQAWVMQQVEL